MRIFVVDTNIVFSAMLNTSSRISRILLSPVTGFTFYSTNFLRHEIARHQAKIKKITGLSSEELIELESLVLQRITFIDQDLILEEWMLLAESILADIDIDDAPFLALALQLDCYIWTGDKKLRDGLRLKGYTNVLNTEDLYEMLTDRNKIL